MDGIYEIMTKKALFALYEASLNKRFKGKKAQMRSQALEDAETHGCYIPKSQAPAKVAEVKATPKATPKQETKAEAKA